MRKFFKMLLAYTCYITFIAKFYKKEVVIYFIPTTLLSGVSEQVNADIVSTYGRRLFGISAPRGTKRTVIRTILNKLKLCLIW